jgi:hypothetical protein
LSENDWTWLKLAWLALAARFGPRGAEQRLQRAWEEGALPLRGVPSTIPETREVVEIPASEGGRLTLDCPRSRIVRLSNRGRRQLTHSHSVQVRRADVELLAQADVERLAQKTEENPASATETQEQPVPLDEGAAAVYAQEADTKSQTVAPDAQAADTLPTAMASVLLRLFPNGRPAKRVGELAKAVRAAPGDQLGVFSPRTLERAIALAWPRAKRQRPLKAGKARQT